MKPQTDYEKLAMDELDRASQAQRSANTNIGCLMREARQDAGLTVRQVAAEMALSHPYLHRMEAGVQAWTPHKVKLAMFVIRRLSHKKQ